MDWFERITGFREVAYDDTRAKLSVVDGRLHSTHSDRTCAVGHLETPSLAELRLQAKGLTAGVGKSQLSCVQGDVRALHGDTRNAGALFQVASQFNLLEMVSPEVTPEHGVTRYETDGTQGPACAMAAGAGTIFRNYFAMAVGHSGQRRDRQIDCLLDVGEALGNAQGSLWQMRNGYCLVSDEGLTKVDARLAELGAEQLDDLRSRLRIGLHTDVEVTDAGTGHLLSQAYCSALPVAYNPIQSPSAWQRFASLVLDAAYEATLLSAVLQRERHDRPVVYLTRLGGGVFGNNAAWITAAMRRALECCRDAALDVRLVSHGAPDRDMLALAEHW
jgi:hypothetical protein